MRKKPSFRRYKSENIKKLSKSWRKPRGIQSKVRLAKRGKPASPKIGYGRRKQDKDLHPKFNLKTRVVNNLEELKSIDPKKEIALISSKIGTKLKVSMLEYAKGENLKIANIGDIDKFIADVQAFFEKKKKESKKREEKKQKFRKEAEKKSEEKEKEKEDTTEDLEKDKQKVLTKGE